MSTQIDTPRIYVASLSDYNAGILHGVWIDADQDADAIEDEVSEMLRGSKHPNVTVDCPDCDGPKDVALWVAGHGELCPTCAGKGNVPSAEEWAIHDYEGFGSIRLSEYESLETVSKLAACLEEHGEAFAAWYDNESRDSADDWAEMFQESYQGTFSSLEDYAAQWAEDTGMLQDVPDTIARYFDFEAFGRDMQMGGDVWTARTSEGLAIFSNY